MVRFPAPFAAQVGAALHLFVHRELRDWALLGFGELLCLQDQPAKSERAILSQAVTPGWLSTHPFEGWWGCEDIQPGREGPWGATPSIFGWLKGIEM